jgi:alanine racemase
MTFSPATTRCWAEVDCSALRHNAAVVRELVGPEASILAVVKADGYGHGMVPTAKALAAGGEVSLFGVANVAEAAHLREHLPSVAITIFSPALPDERREAVRLGVVPWISSVEEAEAYARAAVEVRGENGPPFEVEIKVDTGMGRMGVLESDLSELRRTVAGLGALRLVGIVTHLPMSDEDEAFTVEQMVRFEGLLAGTNPAAGGGGMDYPLARLPRRHAQNSAGLIGYDRDGCNVVRPGLMLYGSSPLPAFQARLRPALALKTRVSLVRAMPAGHGISYGRTFVTPRPMRVGTLATGYADGFPRHLSNVGAEVLIRGRRCAVLGRVTMDQVMVDLSELPQVAAGEEAVLIGKQGDEEILAAEMAKKAGTIAWEIFTGLTTRVGRYYVGG